MLHCFALSPVPTSPWTNFSSSQLSFVILQRWVRWAARRSCGRWWSTGMNRGRSGWVSLAAWEALWETRPLSSRPCSSTVPPRAPANSRSVWAHFPRCQSFEARSQCVRKYVRIWWEEKMPTVELERRWIICCPVCVSARSVKSTKYVLGWLLDTGCQDPLKFVRSVS